MQDVINGLGLVLALVATGAVICVLGAVQDAMRCPPLDDPMDECWGDVPAMPRDLDPSH